MGIEALYRRPRTTKPEPGHKIYPYLLRGMEITRPNQVWAMDISYIPMARGFVYLAVVLDWASRRVLSWRLSITMEAAFCVETLEDALARHGKPKIFNTDQGAQFTGSAFTGVLASNGIAISMDGKGAWRDNVFVERLWRSIKYEEVYLRAYETVGEARSSIGRYLDFYNERRPHSSLDDRTPNQAYFDLPPLRAALAFIWQAEDRCHGQPSLELRPRKLEMGNADQLEISSRAGQFRNHSTIIAARGYHLKQRGQKQHMQLAAHSSLPLARRRGQPRPAASIPAAHQEPLILKRIRRSYGVLEGLPK